MDGPAIQPGSLLAGRYRVEDRVGETAGATTWRAFDATLNRSVGIQALPADDPRCPALIDAARRSTTVNDPRFLRVLDAVLDENGVSYVVREWARAVPLADLLREGPLSARRAADLVGEVAEAIASAHDAGVPHLRLDPTTIWVKDSGAVRISGLATDHALHTGTATPERDAATGRQAAEESDVRALGRVLYACLVARWPGGRDFGLSPAPTEHGRLLRPRQVRAGVSRDADRVCDRILGQPPRHSAPPLRTARDVAAALAVVGDDESEQTATDPGLRPVAGLSPGMSDEGQPIAPSASLADATAAMSGGSAKLIWLGIALLVLVAAVLAFFVGRHSGGTVTAPAPVPVLQLLSAGPNGLTG